MTVWECMIMLGHDANVRVFEGERELTNEPCNCYDFERYCYKYPRELFDAILEKNAIKVDLVNMIIYCER